jgi:hypothetical protein
MVAGLLGDLGQALVDLEISSPLTVFPLVLLFFVGCPTVTGADPIADAKANMRRQQIAGCSDTDNKAYLACVDAVSTSLHICDMSKKLWQCLPACACNSAASDTVEALRVSLAAGISVIKLVEPSTDCGDSSTWKCGSVVGFKSSAAGLHATVFTGIIASLATLLASY